MLEGHRRTYCGRVVFGRYFNHTKCTKHCNVQAKLEIMHEQDSSGNITATHSLVVFSLLRDVTEDEPLLWNYFNKTSIEDFPDCPICNRIGIKDPSYNGTILPDYLEPIIGSDSSLVPERILDLNSEFATFLFILSTKFFYS